MRTLDFLVGEHHGGLNVTVRRGYKWADLKVGEVVALATAGVLNSEPDFTKAVIYSVTVKSFFTIQAHEIAQEHDPDCRNMVGLLAAMERAYPDFTQEDVCVIVGYIPEK